MGKYKKFAIIGNFVLIALVIFSGVSFSDGTELLPDEQLLQAVSSELGVPREEITTDMMLDLESLTARGINSLTGLWHAENLERLRLKNLSFFAELEPIFELRQLELLEITGSIIETDGIERIKDLSELEILRLDGNKIVDISLLVELSGIRELSLADNEIVELEGLEKLASLQVLNLSGNRIIDITPLSELENLNYLDLSGNQLKSVEPLLKHKGLTEGDVIHLRNNFLDFSPGSKTLENIKTLKSRGIQVTIFPQRSQIRGEDTR